MLPQAHLYGPSRQGNLSGLKSREPALCQNDLNLAVLAFTLRRGVEGELGVESLGGDKDKLDEGKEGAVESRREGSCQGRGAKVDGSQEETAGTTYPALGA